MPTGGVGRDLQAGLVRLGIAVLVKACDHIRLSEPAAQGRFTMYRWFVISLCTDCPVFKRDMVGSMPVTGAHSPRFCRRWSNSCRNARSGGLWLCAASPAGTDSGIDANARCLTGPGSGAHSTARTQP